MNLTSAAFHTHLAATLYMTGLIWFVQIVHYPLFAAVPPVGFPGYQKKHMQRTALAVGPAMLLELASAVALWVRPPAGWSFLLTVNLVLLTVIWLSTFLLQTPRHERLLQGFAPRVHSALTASNWIRTAAWTARSGLALWMTAGYARPA